MLLSAVRDGACEPIKVPSIRVFSRFRSRPNGSVTAPVIRVLSCVFSHRAARARATRRTPPPPPAARVHGPPRTATPPPFGSTAHGRRPPSTRRCQRPRRRPTREAAERAPPARNARAGEPATQGAPAAPLSPPPPGISPPTRSRRRVCGARLSRSFPRRQPQTLRRRRRRRWRPPPRQCPPRVSSAVLTSRSHGAFLVIWGCPRLVLP